MPFSGQSDKALVCTYVVGLPATVKQLLRAGSRMDELPIVQICTRATAVLTDEVGVAGENWCWCAREANGCDVKASVFRVLISRIIWLETLCFAGRRASTRRCELLPMR